MSLLELIDQARYGSAEGYDNLDMLRETLTKAEKQALLDVIEEEFEDMREDIMDAYIILIAALTSRKARSRSQCRLIRSWRNSTITCWI